LFEDLGLHGTPIVTYLDDPTAWFLPRGKLGYDPHHTAERRVDTGPEIDLEKAEFFRALAPERLARVKPLLRQRRFERQQVLYFEGNSCDRLWVVRQGEVRLYKSSTSGEITTLDVLGPGEMFGAVAALEQDRYPSSAEAVTEGSVWWLPRESFTRILEAEPRLAVEILSVVSRRLRDAQNRLRSFAQDPAPSRLALALLHAASEGEARVTRRALAEAAGTTVETAIRVLRRFEREGLVRGEVGRVHVLDEPALRKMAGP
jgi:CRP/FNR family transcriptional regulator